MPATMKLKKPTKPYGGPFKNFQTKVIDLPAPKVQQVKVNTLADTVAKTEELLKRQGRQWKTNKAEENGELVRVSIFIS